MVEREVSGKLIRQMARTAHEMNRAYCKAMGDESQVPWDEAPKEIQDSAIQGVLFRMVNVNATPEDSHNSWSAFKVANGWVYGEEKNMEKKTHPCLVPYADLPDAQKAKDYLFIAAVEQVSLLAKEGFNE